MMEPGSVSALSHWSTGDFKCIIDHLTQQLCSYQQFDIVVFVMKLLVPIFMALPPVKVKSNRIVHDVKAQRADDTDSKTCII